jgi:spectinomycin phosphotransferase
VDELPALPARVARALREHYRIEPTALEPTERGKDFFASVYRVFVGDPTPRYVVKLRREGAARDTAAAVARHLADAGVPGVVAPIRSTAGDIAATASGMSLVVYPFIEGSLGIEMHLSDEAWRNLGRFARRLHETTLPAVLADAVRRESYTPPEIETISRIDAAVARWGSTGALEPARRVVELWRERRAEILDLATRAAALGDHLRERGLPAVICHADLHTGNLIVDRDDRPWIIDWDEAVLAPRERDLMFAVGGGISTQLVSQNATARFLEGYGDVDNDLEALAYYRHAWAVQDVGGYAWRVVLDDSATDAQRDDAAEILVGLFKPGEIVDLAANERRDGRAGPSGFATS